MQLRFEGLVAVVTGAAQGIGRAVAGAFCDAGATVVVCDLDAEGVAATAAELGISQQVLDLSDRSAVAEAMERVEQTCGPIDILVNAAGGVRGQVGRPIEEIDEEQWRTIFAANVDSAFWLAQAVAPQMTSRGRGRIITIASGAGLRPSLTGIQAYTAATFHCTRREDFLQATTITAFSLVEIAQAFQPHLSVDASCVTIGISSTLVTAENYGYLSPIKSALEGCVRNLAKSFSRISRVRFNSVNAGPLKTSASAGIPGYLENYLYAEKLTMRKMAVRTAEVADTAVFLLSERSSGINGQGIVVNAGMDLNYFDSEIIRLAMRPDKG